MTAQTQTRPLTPRRKSELNRVTATDVCILAFLLVFSGLVLYPFYNSVLISMTPQVVYIREPFMLWPKALDWSSYQYVFENKSIWMGMWTTVQITIFGTLYNIFLTVTMAYALNHSFPGKKAVIALIMFTMYFSGGLIPTYMMIKDFGLMNTLWSMILPTGVSISYLMVMRKFFKSIPDELEESAKIDGANDLTIMFRIVLPLALPMVITFVIYYGVERWNEWYNGMLFIRSFEKRPLQLVLRGIIQTTGQAMMTSDLQQYNITPFSEGIKMACIVVTATPIILVYPFIQKYFVSGLTVGAVKG